MIVVLSEDSFRDPTSINGRELRMITETARLFGCRVVPLPPSDFVEASADSALEYLPSFESPVPGIWVGYIPQLEWYTHIYHAACAKGVFLINTPQQHQIAMEFDLALPLLGELTPQSRTASSLEDSVTSAKELGFPVFVRGAIKSNKEQGWSACVAKNEAELGAIVSALLGREQRSRGKVIVRRLARLRHIAVDPQGFPLGREYRVLVYQGTIVAYGFYWEEYEEGITLSTAEEAGLRATVLEAARRLQVPYIAIDVAQLEDGSWTVIETNEAQFAGLSQIPVLKLWSKIKDFQMSQP